MPFGSNRLSTFTVVALLCGAGSSAAHATGTTYDIGAGYLYPTLSAFANRAHDAQGNALGWYYLVPGDKVLIHPGTYNESITIGGSAQGTAANPITIAAADDTNPPTIQWVLVDGAQHIILHRIIASPAISAHYDTCAGSTSAFALVNQAAANTIEFSTAEFARDGIYISGDSTDNVIKQNDVHHNCEDGIGVDQISSDASVANDIVGNSVHDNGAHGIALIATRTTVEWNTVYANGQNANFPGASGIHVMGVYPAGTTPARIAANNVVKYNLVYGTKIPANFPTDGNGIQLDYYADNNSVYFNSAYGNDGPGITLWGAANNLVFNNTVYGNKQTGGVTEVFVGSDNTTATPPRSWNNFFANNLIYPSATNVGLMSVDGYSVNAPTGTPKNVISNQLLYAVWPALALAGWNNQNVSSVSVWNSDKAAGATGALNDVYADPKLKSPASVSPSANAGDNLALSCASSSVIFSGTTSIVTAGVGINTLVADPSHDTTDILKRAISQTSPPIGAYTVSCP